MSYTAFTNIHLLEGEQTNIAKAKGWGWVHIGINHGLTNYAVLQDISTESNQTVFTVGGYHTPIYFGTTYEDTNNPSLELTVFVICDWNSTINGYSITNAYPLNSGLINTREGIISYSTVNPPTALVAGRTKSQFPSWFNNGDFTRVFNP